MKDADISLYEILSPHTDSYLESRLDGARDLYLVALLLGRRGNDGEFGRLIREARIHFAAVIEEARIAGLDTTDIASLLSNHDLDDAIRPELRDSVEELFVARFNRAH